MRLNFVGGSIFQGLQCFYAKTPGAVRVVSRDGGTSSPLRPTPTRPIHVNCALMTICNAPMAPIHRLPDELLGEILGYLDTARRRGEDGGVSAFDMDRLVKVPGNPVLRFCLVCRWFFRVGEPVLYSFFSNGMDHQVHPHASRRQFLHRIIQRPDLAARVSEVRFDVMEHDIGSVTRPRRNMYGIVGYADEESDEDSDAGSDRHGHDDAEDLTHYYSDEEDEDENAILNLNSRADRLAFTTAAHPVEMQNKSSWLEDLRAGVPYAELVLLLCQTLNLTKLILRVPDKSGYDFNCRNLRLLLGQIERDHASGRSAGPLRSLRTLEVEYAADKVESAFSLGFPAQYMREFFAIPSLQELKGHMITTRSRYTEGFESDSDTDADDADDADASFAPFDNNSLPDNDDDDTPTAPAAPTWPSRTSRIRSLALTNANITHTTLHQLLAACATLTRLHLAWSTDDLFHPATALDQPFDPPAIRAALALHAATLVSLTLHADTPFFSALATDDPDAHPLPRLGSLAALAALKILSISGLLLTGTLRRDAVTVLAKTTRRRVRCWATRAPALGYARLAADAFPDGLEALGIAVGPHVEAEGAVLAFLAPLAVEIARGVGAGERLRGLRRLALEGRGWGRKMAPGRVAEVCAGLRGTGVVLVRDGREFDGVVSFSFFFPPVCFLCG